MKESKMVKWIFCIIVLVITTQNCRLGSLYREDNYPGKLGKAEGSVEGKACAFSYLYLISTGDASIEEAKRISNITKIRSIDIQVHSILTFVVVRHCLILTGEIER
ncbi:TRL-like family protein [Leptospira levettii]|uniref:TRL-like family protein n=1 Tax=Leptospira levettii TaxID=2023178 RepID=A0A5F2DBF9_9LEPT|nr:TRL-like family protein [Leptospira levettii]PKA24934.1 TRL-like family protein [Leptospira sp. mixed culture ATI2-C-A1]MCW7464441.1 TRL-like family protein [Leptospira levettii]MCW7495491.1 TRL-like family protein [Leptospira levettii]MCW7508323.1 TRL-like family protein [Leptospira levettii]MCW7511375.1 TRL-like family protein [Leptospira levettii]